MTRKDYELIARAINSAEIPQSARKRVALRMANELNETNQLLDLDKFMAACGAPRE